MILHITRDEFVGSLAADLPCGAGGHAARINGVKIAPCRQNINTAACRGAGGAGCNKSTIQRFDQSIAFSSGAFMKALCGIILSIGLHIIEHQLRGVLITRPPENMQTISNAHFFDVA